MTTKLEKGSKRNKITKVWIVVSVIRGIPDTIEAYKKKTSAMIRKQELEKGINPDEDEVTIAKVKIR